ncbi:MAG: carbohydrate ABC transporter permease [Clostridiales bacterium]|jgi:multiple sugar transport system permease protein|nr:carbohydrate ABC transporter permease [Clostridiales bacterium]
MVNESKFFKTLRYVFLILSVAFVIVPIVPTIFTALKTGAEYQATSVMSPPSNWLNTYNFTYALKAGTLLPSLGTTLIILAISLIFSVNFACMTSFVLQRFNFKLKGLIMALYTATMFIPVVTTQVVVFRIMYYIGLVGNIGSLIILYSGTSIVDIYIVINILNSIPKDLDEAALLDGAGYFKIYFNIVFPLLKPAVATLAVIKGIGIYNDFYVPNLYLIGNSRTLTIALYKFFRGQSTPFEVMSAAVLMATIPVVIMFLFAQNYIYNGLAGAVKS